MKIPPKIAFLLTLSFLISNCVSVKLASPKPERATNLEFEPPPKPFAKLSNTSADIAWQSTSTGNTIAVLTDCGPQTDITLSRLESETLSALTELKILGREEKLYNGRSAFFTNSEGLMDGVPVHMALVSFQKNDCNFSISYFGKVQFKENENLIFRAFLGEFKSP